MFRTPVSFLFVLIAVSVSYADGLNPIKWRPFSPNEFANGPTIEESSSAEASIWETRFYQSGRSYQKQFYGRIKLFDSRGVASFSSFSIDTSSQVHLEYLVAKIYKSDGSEYQTQKVDRIAMPLLKAGDYRLDRASLLIPQLQPGDVVDVQYSSTIESDLNGLVLDFQTNIACRDITYMIKADYGGPALKSLRVNLPNVETTRTDEFAVFRRRRTLPLIDEPLLPPKKNLIPWLLLMRDNDPSVDATAYWKRFSQGLNYFYDWIKTSDRIRDQAKALTSGVVGDRSRIETLARFCRSKIRNVTHESLPQAEKDQLLKGITGVEAVLDKQRSSDLLVDVLFASLAKSLDYDTRFVYASDRNNFFFQRYYLSGSLLHYVGVAVKYGDQWYFAAPGSKYLPLGQFYWTHEGEEVMLTSRDGFEWISPRIPDPTENRNERLLNGELSSDGTLSGDVRITQYGDEAFRRKVALDGLSADAASAKLREEIAAGFSSIKISNIKIDMGKTQDDPFSYSFSFIYPGYANRSNSRLFFQPSLFEYGRDPIFLSNTRQNPIYLEYPISEFDDITIKLPEKFKIAQDPEETVVGTDPQVAYLNIRYAATDSAGEIHLYRKFIRGANHRLLYPANDYPEIKSIFDAVFKADQKILIAGKD